MTTLVSRGNVYECAREKGSFGALRARRRRNRPFRRQWEYRRPIPVETLAEKGRPAYTEVGSGELNLGQDPCVMNNSTRECSLPLGCFRGQPTPKLYDRVVEVPRARHYSRRTEEACLHWICRFILFHTGAHPRELREGYFNTFLPHLTVKGNLAASTQNQALGVAVPLLACTGAAR